MRGRPVRLVQTENWIKGGNEGVVVLESVDRNLVQRKSGSNGEHPSFLLSPARMGEGGQGHI